jgi:hypothetical protein
MDILHMQGKKDFLYAPFVPVRALIGRLVFSLLYDPNPTLAHLKIIPHATEKRYFIGTALVGDLRLLFSVLKVRLTECAANTKLTAILAPKPRSFKPAPSQGGVQKPYSHAHSPFIFPLVSHTFPNPPHRSRCYRTTTPISRLFRGPTIP